ncbi:RNA polymerase beta subunit [Pseudomonas phage Noxifer]|uniref:Virion structural protein n=1 Tax=Pseudomonas phage Noxifer TaxID=2006684 RepID=A0A1Y0T376_9CAUD|nr:RNA polymerase beta subunit [Pseudomonas phage Noxifer]ARV77327.1 virion structural protein [Pseudomonas phage Noxifer]
MSMRALAEAELLYFIERILPNGENVKIYKDLFARTSDEQFDEWMDKLAEGEEILALFHPNLQEMKLDLTRNIEAAEELGYPLFQHLYLTDQDTGMIRKTPGKFMVGLVPFRRQAQTRDSKMSVPESDDVVDQLTGQATGVSKGSRMSYPEIQVNLSKGLDKMLLELVKFRAGDAKAYAAMNKAIFETGSVSLDQIMATIPSAVKATESLRVILKAMHIQNNL